MLESKISQFTFSNDGQILWQEKLNSPFLGEAVAIIEKGEHILAPVIKVIENDMTSKYDRVELKNSLSLWLKGHLSEVLEPLMLLKPIEGVKVSGDAVSVIAAKVYDGIGVISRADIEDSIALLTVDTRADLRLKKIRLGPVLAFIPALNKPAAVKLKAILWYIFNDKKLPASLPSDGVVSVKIDDESPNKNYYSAIGYPLYGDRIVRIDMLDRVINFIYDNATGGKFKARHEMAEWLGCSIDDLYKVLEAMGHSKVYDPADDIEKELEEGNKEVVVSKDSKPDENNDNSPKEEKHNNVKPELATFRLKKGKAYSDGEAKAKTFKKPSFDNKKKKDFKKKKSDGKNAKKAPAKRVMSAEAKINAEDSPFAILQQLKK